MIWRISRSSQPISIVVIFVAMVAGETATAATFTQWTRIVWLGQFNNVLVVKPPANEPIANPAGCGQADRYQLDNSELPKMARAMLMAAETADLELQFLIKESGCSINDTPAIGGVKLKSVQ